MVTVGHEAGYEVAVGHEVGFVGGVDVIELERKQEEDIFLCSQNEHVVAPNNK